MSLKVTYVTHACIAIESSFGKLLTDPWILDEPVYALTTWKFPPPRPLTQEFLSSIDYIYISHAHEDHFHAPSLDLFDRSMKIIIPEFVDNPGLRAQTMELMLRKMGFHNVIKLKPFEKLVLDTNNQLTLIPAAKSKYWDWENSGFVFEAIDFKLLNMNDCPGDPELYAQITERFGCIDAAFVQYAGVTMFPGCCKMAIDEMKQIVAERRVGFKHQRTLLDNLAVKRLFPFAGDFAWLREDMLHCNWTNRSTPKLFTDFVSQDYSHKNIEVIVMQPGDSWSPAGIEERYPRIDWDNYLELIREESEKKKNKIQAIRDWQTQSNIKNLKQRTENFLDTINQWLTHQDLDFSYAVQVKIEGAHSSFEFYIKAEPNYFEFSFEPTNNYNHTLIIDEITWACVLNGNLLLTNIQWAAKTIQHQAYDANTARFWFWFENHADLNNRVIQVLVDDKQYASSRALYQPQLGVFDGDAVIPDDKSLLSSECLNSENSKVM